MWRGTHVSAAPGPRVVVTCPCVWPWCIYPRVQQHLGPGVDKTRVEDTYPGVWPWCIYPRVKQHLGPGVDKTRAQLTTRCLPDVQRHPRVQVWTRHVPSSWPGADTQVCVEKARHPRVRHAPGAGSVGGGTSFSAAARGPVMEISASPASCVTVWSVGGADTSTGDPCYCSFTSQTSSVFYDTCIVIVFILGWW